VSFLTSNVNTYFRPGKKKPRSAEELIGAGLTIRRGGGIVCPVVANVFSRRNPEIVWKWAPAAIRVGLGKA